MIVAHAFCTILMIFMNPYYLTSQVMQRIIWAPIRIMSNFFLNIAFDGLENIKSIDEPVIFASNHTHELDPLIIVSSLPFFSKKLPIIFVSLSKHFYSTFGWRGRFLYGGFLFKLIGGFPAYRGLHDYKKALPNHIKALQDGYNVCIFPVGKRHTDTETSQAKGGVIYLAKETESLIVPIHITSLRDLSFWSLITRKHSLRVSFGKPIAVPESLEERDHSYKKEAQDLMRKITDLS